MPQMEVTITPPDSLVAKGLLADFDQLMQSIRRRAYDLFEHRGRKHGADVEDWLRAEAEFLFPVKIESTRERSTYTLRFTLPEFVTKDIQVYTVANNLVLKGTCSQQSATRDVSSDQQQTIFCQFPLPVNTHVDKIKAEYNQGTLTISVPVGEPATSVHLDAARSKASSTATAAA